MRTNSVVMTREVAVLPPMISLIPTAGKVSKVVSKLFVNSALPMTSVVMAAPAIPTIAQPTCWASFARSSVPKVVMGLVVNQAQNVSSFLWSKGMQYWWGKGNGEAENLAVVTHESQVVQDKYKEVMGRLTPLIVHFHDEMRRRVDGNQSMELKLEEALRLQLMLDGVTEDDLNVAVRNLSERLGVIVTKQQENLPILLAVMDDLQAAEKDLAQAVAELEKVKREFDAAVEELAIFKLLIEDAGLEQDEELKGLIRKLDGVLNGV